MLSVVSRRNLFIYRRALACHYSVSNLVASANRSGDQHEYDQQPWRKKQLDRLETKFTASVETEEELQPMWKSMESRVKQRRPRTIQETGGKSGRANVKQTEEDAWLEAGLYDELQKEK